MPAAIAPCLGSMRLVEVAEFNKRDVVECPFCEVSPKAERRSDQFKRFYLIPNHRPVGHREPKSIDWSNPHG